MKIISKSKYQMSNKKSGFTLVEVLMAAIIFAIVVLLGVASFGSIINLKKKVTSDNTLQEVGRHAMEIMANEIEKTDLNKSAGIYVINPGSQPIPGFFYGFRMLNPSTDDFLGGQVGAATQLKTYNPASANSAESDPGVISTDFRWDNVNKKILKGTDPLTPSNVQVTSLTFSGYQKTSDNIESSSYQQPYVTISMKLSMQTVNPSGQPETKTADFRTTLRPQPVESMGYAEVRSGSDNTPGDGVNFIRNFSKKPTVVIARASMNEDDQDSYIGDTFLDHFTYSSSINDQSIPANRTYYWLAVNGSYPNLVKSGQVKGDTVQCQSPNDSACINYTQPFSSGEPVSFITRENKVNAPLSFVRENTLKRLVVSGHGWNGLFNWVSINNAINDLKLNNAITPTLKIGNSRTTNSGADPTLSCQQCECKDNPLDPAPHPVPFYSCAFYYRTTDYFRDPNLFQVKFGVSFNKNPNVLVTVKNLIGSTSSFDNATESQLNTPGVRNINSDHFTYTNLGNSGNSGETSENVCPDQGCKRYNEGNNTGGLFTPDGINALKANYSVNWAAMSDDFKLTWEYR